MNNPIDSITARSVTIVDEQDRPRIRAHVKDGVGEVVVQLGDDPSSHVLIYAGRIEPTGTEGVGVEVYASGDSVGRVSAVREGREWRLSRAT